MIKFHSSHLKCFTNKENILVSKNYWISNNRLLLTETFYCIDKNCSVNFISSYRYLTLLLTQSLTNVFSCSYYKYFFHPIKVQLLHLIFNVFITNCVLFNQINNVLLFCIKTPHVFQFFLWSPISLKIWYFLVTILIYTYLYVFYF